MLNSTKKSLFVVQVLLILLVNWLLVSEVHASTNEKDKVLIIVSSDSRGYWLPEVVEPYYLLEKAGFEMDIASPKGGSGKASGTSRMTGHHKKWFKKSKLSKQLENAIPMSEVETSKYRAVYVAGGAGPMFDLINNGETQNVIRDIYEAGGLVSADCHGPAALLNVYLSDGQRLIEGRKVTAKANIEEGRWARSNYPFLLENKMQELGAIYSAAAKNEPHVVVDGRLITGQNPASAIPVAESLIEALQQK